eukprot:9114247-Pyramimonas_sp.AAC.1
MAHLLKSPSLMTGGVADGLMRVWRSRVVSPTSCWMGGTDGGYVAASAAGLNASVPAVIGVAGCPAQPSVLFGCRS